MFKKYIEQFIEFTAPVKKYPEQVQRAKASLLGGLLFVGGTFYIIFILVEFALNIRYSLLITVSRIATVLAIYTIGWLNREGHFNIAFILNGLVPFPIVFFSVAILPITQGAAITVLLVTIPLASSVFSSVRITSLMYLAVSIASTYFMLVVLRVSYSDVSVQILSVWLVGGLLVLVAAYRNYLENLRQGDLLKSEKRYRTLLETSFEAVCVVRDGVLAEVNDGFAKMFDISALENPVGTSIEKWLILPQNLDTLAETTFETTPNPLHQTLKLQGKVLEVVFRQTDDSEQKKTLFVAIRDITQRKLAERLIRQNNEILESRVQERTQELRQEVDERKRVEVALQQERISLAKRVEERTAALSLANQELMQAAHTKDEFLASMSHELRTPLTGILGISEALLEEIYGALEESQIEVLRELEASGHHLLALINDILDLAKINSGGLSIEREPVNVAELCHSALSLVRPMLTEKHLQIQVDIQADIGELLGDSRRLKQVVVNLLGNAIKFTEREGNIGLKVLRDGQREAVRITVWDNGIGIPIEAQKNLFQPFVQVDSRLSRGYQGTGLGLAIVYNLVQLHGGSVELESVPGRGSRFSVLLPSLASNASPNPMEHSTLSATLSAAQEAPTIEKTPPTAPQLPVLIVDDNLTTLTMVSNYLKAQNIDVAVAHSGFDALERVKTFNPSLILMDIQMPGMDGLEAIREIRKMPKFSTTPILALTALVMPGDQERCLMAGATEYISKPVSLKQLLNTIYSLVKPEG